MIIQDGFEYGFNPQACSSCGGRCCKGRPGYIWISQEEIEELAKFLDVTEKELEKGCLKRVGEKTSIKDYSYKNERVCFFFDNEKNNCSIYAVRPKQCRTFPFWDSLKNEREYLEEECPAVVY